MNGIAEEINLNERIIIPEPEFRAFIDSLGWTWQQAARGEVPEPFVNLEDFQLACISDDPYLWCTFFLKEPTDPKPPEEKGPYSFWDYQVVSLRWLRSFIHYDGAEVGKSREIVAKSLYFCFNNPHGSGLIGAPETKYLRPIIRDIENQLEWNPELGEEVKKIEKAGDLVTEILFKNGFVLYFRHSGHDGRPYRSIHVRTFAFKDEAAKDHNQLTWSEFYRALEPGCITGLYSVPDGNLLEFWRRGQEARELSKSKPYSQFKYDELRFFNWPKTLMPNPYWSPERRLKLIREYQGENHPDYLHNVLGLDGDPEASVFPWVLMKNNIKDIPEYRCLKITKTTRGYSIIGYSINGLEANFIIDRVLPFDEFGPDFIRQFFTVPAGLTLFYMGADLGYSPDPSVFYVKAVIGNKRRLIARVYMESMEYPEQGRIFDALDDVYDDGRNETVSGLDAGNAGTAFYQYNVENFPGKKYKNRMHPISMASKHAELDSKGRPVMDKFKDKPIERRAKSLATKMITRGMYDQNMEYPHDPELVRTYPAYTAKKGSDGDLIYSEKNDHDIAADQAGEFAHGRMSKAPIDIAGIETSGVKLMTVSRDMAGVFHE